MANPAKDLLAAGLKDLEKNIGEPTFTWLGIEYTCSKSSLRKGVSVEFGGKIFEIQFTLIVRKSVIASAALPVEPGKTLTVDGAEYRVAFVRDPSPGAHFQYDLIDVNR